MNPFHKLFPEPKDLPRKAESGEGEANLERFPFEHKFNAFTKQLQEAFPLEPDEVSGKKKAYASLADITKFYYETFGDEGVALSSIRYRMSSNKDTFGDDVQIDEEARQQRGESVYFINRANTELLKKIFMPTPLTWGDKDMETVLDDVAEGEEFMQTRHEEDIDAGVFDKDEI